MSDEMWLPVVGFEDRYEVSNLGRVRPVGPVRGRAIVGDVLAFQLDRKGYVFVSLWRDHNVKRRPVHQLVAEAFIGPRPVGGPPPYVIDHLDSNPGNNRVENLEWVTPNVNLKRAYERGYRHKPDCVCITCTRSRNPLSRQEKLTRGRESAIRRHVAITPIDATFQCEICERRFTNEKARSVHLARMHPLAGVLACEQCERPATWAWDSEGQMHFVCGYHKRGHATVQRWAQRRIRPRVGVRAATEAGRPAGGGTGSDA